MDYNPGVRIPHNAITGKEYRAGNIDRLLAATEEMGYDPERGWATLRQWRSIGRRVKMYEKGTNIFYVGDSPSENGATTKYGKRFVVFHMDQTKED